MRVIAISVITMMFVLMALTIASSLHTLHQLEDLNSKVDELPEKINSVIEEIQIVVDPI